jgi:hypothetical protein
MGEIMEQTDNEKKVEAEYLTNSKNSGEWFNDNSGKKDEVTKAKRELLEDYHTGGSKEVFIEKWVSVKEDLEERKEHFRTGGDPEAAQLRADNKTKIEVQNEYLLKEIKDNEPEKIKFILLMRETTKKLDEAEDLKQEEKENIAKELNTKYGVGVIKYFHKSAPDLIYAGLCMAKGGDPYLGEMHTRPDNRPKVDEEFTINNKYLMKEVEGLPDLTEKYLATQKELSNKVFYSQISFSDKKKIVNMLNSEAGTKLIAKHTEQAEVTIYASLCASDGNEKALDKYELKEDVKKESIETGRKISQGKNNNVGMEI